MFILGEQDIRQETVAHKSFLFQQRDSRNLQSSEPFYFALVIRFGRRGGRLT
jgi:hypothetical protein